MSQSTQNPKKRKKKEVDTISKANSSEDSTKLPIVPKPDTWYFALFYDEPEVILTNHDAKFFYIHGDQYVRGIDKVVIKKEIASRAEALKKIKANLPKNP